VRGDDLRRKMKQAILAFWARHIPNPSKHLIVYVIKCIGIGINRKIVDNKMPEPALPSPPDPFIPDTNSRRTDRK
jgi:hypothetical protein